MALLKRVGEDLHGVSGCALTGTALSISIAVCLERWILDLNCDDGCWEVDGSKYQRKMA